MSICGICKESFLNKRGLKKHKKASHGGYFTTSKEERSKDLEQSIPVVETISMPEDDAKTELKEYRKLLETRKETYLQQMKDSLVQLAKGRKLININEVMRKVGVGEDGFPRLAIARADGEKVYLHRHDEGRVDFSLGSSGWEQYKHNTIWMPAKTFAEFKKTEKEQYGYQVYEALIPIIPAVFLPTGKLKNYWILWEVEQWSKTPAPPNDPILLKRINESTFAVLAVWDLTPLERSITAGR